MWADDGHSNRWFFVDGEPSGTRFGITGTAQIAPGLRAGARFETEWQSNSSDSVSFQSQSDSPGLAERWFDVWLEGGWGRVNLGQGSAAADDASTIDLSGTSLADGLCTCDWGGRIGWRDGAGALAGGTIGATHNNQDFESRYDRLMYTTPVFGGFRAQVSTGQKSAGFPPAAGNSHVATNEAWEASVWFSGKVAGDLSAAIGYSNEKASTPGFDDNETIGGSVSWLSAAGFSITLAYTEQTFSVAPALARDGTHLWGKVGFKFGAHAVSVSYGQTEDQFVIGEEGKVYGLGYVWNPVRWAELYAAYHMFQLDRPAPLPAPEDINVFAVGTRIRF